MAKLKLGAVADDKRVKVTVELPAALHHDLSAYAKAMSRESGQQVGDPVGLIVPVLPLFIATDRRFVRSRKATDRGQIAACYVAAPDWPDAWTMSSNPFSAGLGLDSIHTAEREITFRPARGTTTTPSQAGRGGAPTATVTPNPKATMLMRLH